MLRDNNSFLDGVDVAENNPNHANHASFVLSYRDNGGTQNEVLNSIIYC